MYDRHFFVTHRVYIIIIKKYINSYVCIDRDTRTYTHARTHTHKYGLNMTERTREFKRE